MKLGLFTPVFSTLSVKDMLAKVRALRHVQAIEIGTGGWPGKDHLDVDALLDKKPCALEYRTMIADAGLTISALSCRAATNATFATMPALSASCGFGIAMRARYESVPALVAAFRLATVPVQLRPGIESSVTVDAVPVETEPRSESGIPTATNAGSIAETCTSGVPGDASDPGSTLRSVTTPSNGAVTAA